MNRSGKLVAVAGFAVVLGGLGLWVWSEQHRFNEQYAGQQTREIKALSPEQIEGLKAGAGLGYAKSAELNGWPGPLHVLELADRLSLTDEQRAQMEDLRQQMLAKAKPLGQDMIAAEKALEDIFSGDDPAAKQVEAAVQKIASIEARLRAVHLTTHLLSAPVLNEKQKEIYQQARGYGSTHNHTSH